MVWNLRHQIKIWIDGAKTAQNYITGDGGIKRVLMWIRTAGLADQICSGTRGKTQEKNVIWRKANLWSDVKHSNLHSLNCLELLHLVPLFIWIYESWIFIIKTIVIIYFDLGATQDTVNSSSEKDKDPTQSHAKNPYTNRTFYKPIDNTKTPLKRRLLKDCGPS